MSNEENIDHSHDTPSYLVLDERRASLARCIEDKVDAELSGRADGAPSYTRKFDLSDPLTLDIKKPGKTPSITDIAEMASMTNKGLITGLAYESSDNGSVPRRSISLIIREAGTRQRVLLSLQSDGGNPSLVFARDGVRKYVAMRRDTSTPVSLFYRKMEDALNEIGSLEVKKD